MFNRKIFLDLKNKINNNNYRLFIFFLIIFVFLQEFNIFRNIYSILNIDHNKRALRAYEKTFFSGYCKGTSYGYLIYIKKKFKKIFEKNKLPRIINNEGNEIYWIFQNVNGVIDENYIVLLNNKKIIDKNKYLILDEHENKCFFLKKKND